MFWLCWETCEMMNVRWMGIKKKQALRGQNRITLQVQAQVLEEGSTRSHSRTKIYGRAWNTDKVSIYPLFPVLS